MSELAHRHAGRAAVVIGGAPSWPKELADTPPAAVRISANDHACKKVPCNYLVCCDDIGDRANGHNIPVVCRFTWADYRIFDIPLPNSGAVGAWLAWVMGCTPIIIVGVECYTGKTYADDPNAISSGFSKSKAEHLQRWSRLKGLCPVGGNFRSIGGPLGNIFPTWHETEPTGEPAPKADIMAACRGVLVHMLANTELNGRNYKKDGVYEVDSIEERYLYRRSLARRLNAC